jgi:hypothetical protein
MGHIRYALAVGIVVGALLLPLGATGAGEALALSSAACNSGTENAHERIPEGRPAHERVPEDEGSGCQHDIGPTDR